MKGMLKRGSGREKETMGGGECRRIREEKRGRRWDGEQGTWTRRRQRQGMQMESGRVRREEGDEKGETDEDEEV